MKKKIALFANNWNSDNLMTFLDGARKTLPKNYADIFIFLAANTYGRSEVYNKSECAIHFLPDLNSFDAAIIFSQGLNSNEVRDKIYDRCREAKIPTVCIGDKDPDFYGVLVDNKTGMMELCNHLYDVHHMRTVKFFAGAKENDDSNLRLECLREFAEKKKIPFSDADVLYTNWEIRSTMNYITGLYNKKESLPDAFVLANDFLAVASCLGIEKNGFKVPNDISVTGFDNVRSGRTFYPSISTVEQRFDIQGEKCIEVLLKVFDGEEAPRETYVESKFLPGESCGCVSPRNEDDIRRGFCHELISRNMEDNARAGMLAVIRNAFAESSRFSMVPAKLQSVFYSVQDENLDTIHIMIDPLFENIILKETPDNEEFTFADNFQVLVSKERGEQTNVRKIKRPDLVPGYTGEGENNIYVLMPLHLESYVCGYMVMRGIDMTLRSWLFFDYEANLNRSIAEFKTTIQLAALNDKLSELMQTDALTSLKNRTAYENAKTMLKNHYLSGDGTKFAIVMFDLNNLKKINDELGHGAGDVYIKNSSELICHTFKHSPVYRVGGDEFVAIVKNSDYQIKEELLYTFRKEVDNRSSEDIPLMDRVSVASGMADIEEIVEDDVDSVFRLADERMYENKRLMKAERGK